MGGTVPDGQVHGHQKPEMHGIHIKRTEQGQKNKSQDQSRRHDIHKHPDNEKQDIHGKKEDPWKMNAVNGQFCHPVRDVFKGQISPENLDASHDE